MTLNFYNSSGFLLHKDKIVLLVNEVNSNCSFGYTDKHHQIIYNLNVLYKLNILDKREHDYQLLNSREGLTSVFPLGRYIVILKIKNDRTSMEMLFLDFRIGYSDFDDSLKSIFSEKIRVEFKRIKYEMEDEYDESRDNVELYS